MMTSDELTRFRDWHKTFEDKLPTQKDVLGWIEKDRATQMQSYRSTTKRYPMQYYNMMGLNSGIFNATPPAGVGQETLYSRPTALPAIRLPEEAFYGPSTPGGDPSGLVTGPENATMTAGQALGLLGMAMAPVALGPAIFAGLSIPGALAALNAARSGYSTISGIEAGTATAADTMANALAQSGALSGGLEGYGTGSSYGGGGYGMPGGEGVGGLW